MSKTIKMTKAVYDYMMERAGYRDLRARYLLVILYGMSEAVHELGLDLVFDSDFRIYLAGATLEWHGEIEE